MNLVPNATFGGVIQNSPQLNIEQRFPFFGTNNIWNWSDNLSKIWGSHNLKAGFTSNTPRATRRAAFNGTFNFDNNVNNPENTGHPFANALIGSVNSYTEANGKLDGHARYKNIEWFLARQLEGQQTADADYGLRFYYIQPTISAGDNLSYFDQALYDARSSPHCSSRICTVADVAANPAVCGASAGRRVARDPASGDSAVKIGAFSTDAGTIFQGMRVVEEGVFAGDQHRPARRVRV